MRKKSAISTVNFASDNVLNESNMVHEYIALVSTKKKKNFTCDQRMQTKETYQGNGVHLDRQESGL